MTFAESFIHGFQEEIGDAEESGAAAEIRRGLQAPCRGER
jgi:hypothetical protein